MWIYEHDDWPNFTWQAQRLSAKLADICHRQGRQLGRAENLNFEEVRPSIARRLGMNIAGMIPASRNVESIVEMMLSATQEFKNL